MLRIGWSYDTPPTPITTARTINVSATRGSATGTVAIDLIPVTLSVSATAASCGPGGTVPLTVALTGETGSAWHPHLFHRRRLEHARVTHGPTVPLELAAAVNQFDDGLYRFAHSLSHQMARRFFQLHDVDFSEAAVNAVKGFPSDLGSPNYVMVVRGAALGQEMPEPFVPNDNVYGRFE